MTGKVKVQQFLLTVQIIYPYWNIKQVGFGLQFNMIEHAKLLPATAGSESLLLSGLCSSLSSKLLVAIKF